MSYSSTLIYYEQLNKLSNNHFGDLTTPKIILRGSDQSPLHRPFRRGRSVNQTLHLDALGEQVQTDRPTDQAETDDANAARIHTHAAPRSSAHVGRSIAMNRLGIELCVGFTDAGSPSPHSPEVTAAAG